LMHFDQNSPNHKIKYNDHFYEEFEEVKIFSK